MDIDGAFFSLWFLIYHYGTFDSRYTLPLLSLLSFLLSLFDFASNLSSNLSTE